MLKKITRALFAGLFVFSIFTIPACNSGDEGVKEAALTGDSSTAPTMHERHMTGIDSQVADN